MSVQRSQIEGALSTKLPKDVIVALLDYEVT